MEETNSTIKVMQNHRSVRDYIKKDITDDTLNSILKTVQQMPSSINAQQSSVIIVRNQAKKDAIAKLSREQQHIMDAPVFLIVVMDFYKTHIACEKNHKQTGVVENVNGVMVGAVDSGIMLGAITVASESLGLGTVIIGAIRENISEMCKLLNLPPYVLPVAGVCLGYPNPETLPKVKPRLPFETFAHKEEYHTANMKELVNDYDLEAASYLKSIGRSEQEGNWSQMISKYYATPHYNGVRKALLEQGFKLDQ